MNNSMQQCDEPSGEESGLGGLDFPLSLATDPNLSWRAKGLLIELLARQQQGKDIRPEAVLHGSNLRGPMCEGRAAAREAYRELRHTGYMLSERYTDRGRWYWTHEVRAVSKSNEVLSEPPRRTAVYWYYDESGVLLYVGVTSSLPARERTHARASFWHQLAVRREHEWYPTRSEGGDAEVRAIRDQRPLFNVVVEGHDDLRVRRARRYLISRGREGLCRYLDEPKLLPSVRRESSGE